MEEYQLNHAAIQLHYGQCRENEQFYFQTRNKQEMRYTMCHEVGHGFGLRHTDEEFGNPDLGNCMDYTNQPENNMSPDVTNFEALADMYGVVQGSAASSTSIKTAQENPSDGVNGMPVPNLLVEKEEETRSKPHESLDGSGGNGGRTRRATVLKARDGWHVLSEEISSEQMNVYHQEFDEYYAQHVMQQMINHTDTPTTTDWQNNSLPWLQSVKAVVVLPFPTRLPICTSNHSNGIFC